MSLKDVGSKVVAGIVVVIIVSLGMKGCVVSIWTSPKSPEIYMIEGLDGRAMLMVLLPKNEAMIWHSDPAQKTVEGLLTKMRGTYGTHYFWRLWKVEGPGITLGYRIYPEETEPVHMEITVLERYMSGSGDPVFPGKGESTHQVLVFGKDSLRFQGMWLERMPDNPEIVGSLLAKLGQG